jgi:hypothetical protein
MHAAPEVANDYKIYNDVGEFKMMRSNVLGKDFTYVILDDDSDMLLEQRKHFIKTHSYNGISKSNVKRAIKILNQL